MSGNTRYVVINHEEQYSLWPDGRRPPAGWRTVAPASSRERALDRIEEVWTVTRPRDVRQAALDLFRRLDPDT